MSRRTQEQIDQERRHAALVDIHTAAAEALVNRRVYDVEGVEQLCDGYMRRFEGRKTKKRKLDVIMEALGIDEDEAIVRLVPTGQRTTRSDEDVC